MTKNVEENRKKWPKETDVFVVGDKTVDPKKIWEKKTDYDKGGRYTKVKATTWRSGHSVEVDETEGGERLRVTHANGSYVEFQHNGDVIYRANNDSYEVVVGDRNVRVRGATNVQIDGDANVKVVGDAFMEIGGNFTQTVGGTWTAKAQTIKFETPLFSIEGNRMEHNDLNVGSTHRHRDVLPGPSPTGIPLP